MKRKNDSPTSDRAIKLRVERVTEEDRAQVREISEKTWNGHDYLDKVFDEWVKEEGFYCLKDEKGTIIALDKYTWHENGILWLEGYRVHPHYQGKGYGWKMAKVMSGIIEKLDYKAVRFMTSEANEASIHIGRKMGFQPFAYYTYLYTEELNAPPHPDIKQIKDPEIAMRMVKASAEYGINRKQYLAMWTAYDITKSLIEREVKAGRCYAMGDSTAFFYPYGPRSTMSTAFIGGRKDEMRALIEHGTKLAKETGFSRLTMKSASENAIEAAKEAGMKEREIGMAIVWEKK